MNGVTGLGVRLDVIDGGIGLGAISEGHSGKVLMVSFAVGIQNGVGLPLPDGAIAFHQIELLQVHGIVCECRAKGSDLDIGLEIKTGEHVKHYRPFFIGYGTKTLLPPPGQTFGIQSIINDCHQL